MHGAVAAGLALALVFSNNNNKPFFQIITLKSLLLLQSFHSRSLLQSFHSLAKLPHSTGSLAEENEWTKQTIKKDHILFQLIIF
jgi:hypothetical protein